MNDTGYLKGILYEKLNRCGLEVIARLKNGDQFNLTNAILKENMIINRYFEDMKGNIILFKNIKQIEIKQAK